jgi:hypothetical protein
MPSWNKRRLDRQSEKDLKGKTVLGLDVGNDSANHEEKPNGNSTENIFRATTPTSPRRNRRTRDSVVSLSAVKDAPTQFDRSNAPLPSIELPPPEESRPPRQNRFSLMKFRHASDSQLSKTAKEHADQAPPVPGKSLDTCLFCSSVNHTSCTPQHHNNRSYHR